MASSDAVIPAGSTAHHGGIPLRRSWLIHGRQVLELLAAYAVLTGVFAGIGWLLTRPLDGSGLVRTDQRIERWFVAHRTSGWTSASFWGSQLAETATKVVVTAIVCAALVIVLRRWFEALLVAVPLLLEAAVFLTVTLVVGRPRPDVPRLDGSPVGSSFPSGHTAAAACYAGMAVVVFLHSHRRSIRAAAIALVVLVTAAVGVARMYRGMHHLTDVLAGALLGLASVTVGTWIVRRAASARTALDRTGAHEATTSSRPAPWS